MGKKDMIEVQATGPIRHGDADGVVEYAEGDRFSVSVGQAKQLVETGAVVKPGTKATSDEKEIKEAAKVEAKIDEANAKAEAEAKAAAEATAKLQA